MKEGLYRWLRSTFSDGLAVAPGGVPSILHVLQRGNPYRSRRFVEPSYPGSRCPGGGAPTVIRMSRVAPLELRGWRVIAAGRSLTRTTKLGTRCACGAETRFFRGDRAQPGRPPHRRIARTSRPRCAARERERQIGSGYGFGIFVEGRLVGEVTLSSLQRGPFQNAFVGYWVDEAHAGNSIAPESVVVVMRFAFEELRLHRLEIAIVPRNGPSRQRRSEVGSPRGRRGTALP